MKKNPCVSVSLCVCPHVGRHVFVCVYPRQCMGPDLRVAPCVCPLYIYLCLCPHVCVMFLSFYISF